jgi:hypothetical protein
MIRFDPVNPDKSFKFALFLEEEFRLFHKSKARHLG